jgi:hypothetical protein
MASQTVLFSLVSLVGAQLVPARHAVSCVVEWQQNDRRCAGRWFSLAGEARSTSFLGMVGAKWSRPCKPEVNDVGRGGSKDPASFLHSTMAKR